MRTTHTATRLDPRASRFGATLTSLVLIGVLTAGVSALGYVLLTWQIMTFALGVVVGPTATPYAWLWRRALRPRLGPPSETEDVAPPRFAQGVGLAFTLLGAGAMLAGATIAGLIAVAFALGAALLNAVFGICLGCQLYSLGLRLRASRW